MVINKEKCRELFKIFFKIGAFTFGGGYAMLPFIKREIVEEKKWLTDDEIFDVIAIAESTPGPLAVNAATFVGNKVAGLTGALTATMGVILPSFLIIFAVSQILLQIENFPVIENAFQGIRAGVLVLIGNAVCSLYGQLNKRAFTYAILLLVFVLANIFDINTIFILLFCALLGIAWSYYLEKRSDQ